MKNKISRIFSYALTVTSMIVLAYLLPSCHIEDMPNKRECVITTDSELFILEEGVTKQAVTIKSDRAWNMYAITDPAPEWCEFSEIKGSAGTTTIYLTVDENPKDADARIGKFQFRAGADGTILTVIQKGLPKIETLPVPEASLDEDFALFVGELIYANASEVKFLGFQYRKADSEEEWGLTKYKGKVTSGAYSVMQKDLKPSTTYEYRAYLETADAEYFGELKTFTTYAEAELVTVDKIRKLMEEKPDDVIANYKIEAIVLNDSIIGANWRLSDSAIYYDVVDKSNPTEPNMGITIFVDEPQALYNRGDVVEVKLTATQFTTNIVSDSELEYSFEQKGVRVTDLKMQKTGTAEVAPKVITQNEMGAYQSQLVTIENTQLSEPFINEADYPMWRGTKYMEIKESATPYTITVLKSADFADEIPQRGSGTVTGIVHSSSNPFVYGIMPRWQKDISLTESRFNTSLSFRAYAVESAGDMATETQVNYMLTVKYMNGVKGMEITEPITATISGVDGLIADVLESYIVENNGEGVINIPIKGTPASAGVVRFTVTGLESYGLTGAAAVVAIAVVEKPEPGSFNAVWNLPTTDSGSNSTSYGEERDLGPLTLNEAKSSLEGCTVSSFTMKGFYDGGNYRTTWGGAILPGNSPSQTPVTYVTTSIDIPKGKTASLYTLDLRMRTNNVGVGRIITLQYRIDGGSYINSRVISFEGQLNKADYMTFNLYTVDDLQNIPGGSKVDLRIVPQPMSDQPNAVWTINGNNNNFPTTINGMVE